MMDSGSFEEGEGFEGIPPAGDDSGDAERLSRMHFLPPDAAEQAPEPAPESTDAPPPIEVASFIVKHDATHPEVPAEDVPIVRRIFSSTVDDMLLAYAADVYHTGASVHISSEDTLACHVPLNDGGHYSIGVMVQTGGSDNDPARFRDPSRRPVKEVEVIHFPVSGNRALYRWTEYADGTVRRYTDTDIEATQQRLGDIPDDETIKGFTYEVKRNLELAASLGYQNQQVGIDEINGLADFLHQPGLQLGIPFDDLGG